MTDLILYHNPRCSKSRAALALLEERGLQPTVLRYLDTPPNVEALQLLLGQLGMSARDLLRTGEEAYRLLGVDNPDLSDSDLMQVMAQQPILIERPILVAGDRAIVGRPPERILEILP